MLKTTRARAAVAIATGAIALTLHGAPAGAADGPTFPPRDERCQVPTALFQVAAIVDPDSLEGCGFYEDPNFHENRKDAGVYTDDGIFSRIFG